jgi:formamidopyrimidine-DNA glycosylase
MPELPEVELVKRGLTAVEGQAIDRIKVSDFVEAGHKADKKTIIKQPLDRFLTSVINACILKIGRRGKYLYFILERAGVTYYLMSHLGMSGAFFHVAAFNDIKELNYRKHWQVVFHLSDGSMLVYSDIRRFGEMQVIPSIHAFLPLSEMAPEYNDETAREYFLTQLSREKYQHKPIKAAIMDSRIVTGVGNIYASESLYNAGILPTRKVEFISQKRLNRLFDEICRVFELSISSGGSTISDYRSVSGEAGKMQDRFKVYQKKECPKGHALKTQVIANRNTFYCTTCQK